MADKASSSLSSSILLDEIKSSMSGNLTYEPSDASEKWVFAEVTVTTDASTDLLDTADSYLGSSTQVATNDTIKWICIKNLSTVSTEGVAIDIIAGTAAFDLKGIMIIGGGEMIILKPMKTTVADLHARTCLLDSSGDISAQSSENVKVHVAAILDDAS